MGLIKLLTKFGRQIKDLKIGYDQNATQRWSFLDKKNKKIVANKEGDCSSICAGVAYLAGYPVDISGTVWTGNLVSLMKKAGWKSYKYTNKDAVKTGDMVIRVKHHVVLALSKTEWLSPQANEKGTALGGKPGNQTGREVVIRAPYENDWDYILRPPADKVVLPEIAVTVSGAQLAAALKSVGSSTTRSKVRTRADGTATTASLETLASLCTLALAGHKLNGHAVSVFVATMLQESAWFATTVEYGNDKKKYDPYRGRTFEQLTWKDNYLGFGKWCHSKNLVPSDDYFVKNPELLGDLEWAWLGGVWYFTHRSLWAEASSGDFQRVQTAVNLGSASSTKVPSGWTTRLMAYRAFLSAYDKPAALDVNTKVTDKTQRRLQEFVGAEIDGSWGPQTWFLVGKWLGLPGKFDILDKSDVKVLQKKIGLKGDDVDGVWWMSKSKVWGPTTTAALQRYLNANR